MLPPLARDAAKNKKGSGFAPLFYFRDFVTLLRALRSMVMSLMRVRVTSVMSVVVMMSFGSGWCGFRRFWLGSQNG